MERTVKQVLFPGAGIPKLTRIAAYARVSSGKDAMLHSLSAQVSYYSNLIQNHKGWQYVGVYADEALTGTQDNREKFQQMLSDCRDGKIDMVITKSISRFARNTITLLETVRQLKALGVDVYFEEQNIHTMSADGELMMTILASYAQEESLSASENMKWRIRKGFERGEIMNLRFLYGYAIKKGVVTVNPAQARIVQEIFHRFNDGESMGSIAADLNARNLKGTRGGEWCQQRIHDVVTNEKYLGNALLQKKFTVDFLQKKIKVNEGEVPQCYVENSHPPIIQPDEWDRVQAEFQRRKAQGKNHNCNRLFSAQIVCGDCSEYYGSKVWHSNSKYRRVIWQCNGKFKNEEKCKTPHLYDTDIQRLFMSAVGKLYADRATILETCRLLQSTLTDNTSIDAECEELSREMDVVAGLIRSCIEENASQAVDQANYIERYNGYVERYEFLKERYAKLQDQRESRDAEALRIGGFMFELRELGELPIAFDERLWHGLIDYVTVYHDERLVFHFKDESEITEQL